MVQEIIEKAKKENKKVYVYAHKFPDGDAINSSCAVVEYLKSQDIEAQYVVTRDIFQYNINIPATKSVQKNSISLILDTNTLSYAENKFFTTSNPEDMYIIDHHEKSADVKCIEDELNIPSQNVIRDSSSSSTCEILANELSMDKISPQIANMLATGLLTDTGRLRYLKPNTLLNLSKLIQVGANYNEITKLLDKKLYLANEVSLAKIFLNAKKFEIGNTFGLIASADNKQVNDFIKSFGLRNIQKKIFKMSDIENCSFTCMFAETSPGQFDLEFRSTPIYGNFDVFSLAKEYGGGGHYSASGCVLKTNNTSDYITSLIADKAQGKYSEQSKNFTPIIPTKLDSELATILDRTDRLTKNVTPEILSEVDSLIKQGVNYDYTFREFKSYERFMLENEILSRVPESALFTRMPVLNISLSQKDVDTLSQKYNVTEYNILQVINIFSDIAIQGAAIKLPNGKKSQIDKYGNINFSEDAAVNKNKEDISL